MAIRQATYAFARPAPYLLERGATQTLTAPIRHGSGGGLIAPDSGTITITRPDGTEFVSGQAVTVSNVVSEHELYARVPELQHRVPQSQGPTDRGGSGEGWQPQIDEAYFELIQKMLDDGKKPWLVREVTGYRKWLLTRALQLCVGTISFGPDSTWSEQSKRLYFEMNKVQSDMRFQLENDDGGTRRGAVPALRIAAVGRPLWT